MQEVEESIQKLEDTIRRKKLVLEKRRKAKAEVGQDSTKFIRLY